MYADFGQNLNSKLTTEGGNTRVVKFGKAVDQDGYLMNDYMHDTTLTEGKQLDNLMFFRVDQEADKKLLRDGYWRELSKNDIKGIKEFRVYTYDSEDLKLFKKFMSESYPKIWY